MSEKETSESRNEKLSTFSQHLCSLKNTSAVSHEIWSNNHIESPCLKLPSLTGSTNHDNPVRFLVLYMLILFGEDAACVEREGGRTHFL